MAKTEALKKLAEKYAGKREKSVSLRIYISDKVRFDALQRRLIVKSDGVVLSQAQILNLLLDTFEGVEQIYKQSTPTTSS